ncbi:MAG: hypothetical protein FJ144_10945 [Deltaproteobacteria bacterium]|nr:hypothetical protein [Deltaproteobacteria bacterium]
MRKLDSFALRFFAVSLAASAVFAACSGSDTDTDVIVFNGEGNRLNAYAPYQGDVKQTVIETRALDPDGWDINAQICFDPRAPRNPRMIVGEDTGQPTPPPGWGYFELEGNEVGALSARRIGKLTPTYQTGDDNAENYGCGFLSDGTLVTSDVGNQAAGPGTGQLLLWFPPFDFDVAYCKLDVEIGTAGQIYVDENDNIYIASARVAPGIYRFSPPYPRSNTAAGGCGRLDSTGAPLADMVQKELFIPSSADIPTPNGIVSNGTGGYYVSSVINGVIAEFEGDGRYVRRVLEPPAGETLGLVPYSTGTPFGLGVDSNGTLYYADIGIIVTSGGIGPGPRRGTVRKIHFSDGRPLPPVTMDSGLNFPDGLGILE